MTKIFRKGWNCHHLFFEICRKERNNKDSIWFRCGFPSTVSGLPSKLYTMFIVHVFVHVKKEYIEEFKSATIENAQNSINEPGIARFDFVEQQDDPTRFVLVEVYRTADDPAKHKETEHYKKWRDTVAEMMAKPRSAIKFFNVHPDENGWG